MGQVWVTNSLGGYLTNNRLSRQLRTVAQPLMKFRQFVSIKDEARGKQKGDTVYFEKLGNVVTPGGPLVETNTMPSTNIVISTDSMTITEYGNSSSYTGKLEALAEWSPKSILQRALRNDMAKVLDSAAAAQFAATEWKYVCSGTAEYAITTDGIAVATAGSAAGHGNLNEYHVKNIVDALRTANIPHYDGENYVCIASVNALRGLKDDSNWINAQLYNQKQTLFNGEVGKYYNCRFIEETNYLSNALGGSYGESIFFGGDAVAEGVAIPEELRAKIPTDYGRSKGVSWYSILGFKKMWDWAADGESHIIHCTSAA